MAAGFLVIVAQWSEHWQFQCSIVTLFSFHLQMFGSSAWIDVARKGLKIVLLFVGPFS